MYVIVMNQNDNTRKLYKAHTTATAFKHAAAGTITARKATPDEVAELIVSGGVIDLTVQEQVEA